MKKNLLKSALVKAIVLTSLVAGGVIASPVTLVKTNRYEVWYANNSSGNTCESKWIVGQPNNYDDVQYQDKLYQFSHTTNPWEVPYYVFNSDGETTFIKNNGVQVDG